MKSTGIVRKVDNLGRIFIPKEVRDTLQFNNNEPLEIFTDGKQIFLKSYNPGCILCGEMKDIRSFKEKKVCQSCIDKMSSPIR